MPITFKQDKHAKVFAVAGFAINVKHKGITLRDVEPLPGSNATFKKLRTHQVKAYEFKGRFVEINYPPRDGKTLCQAARGVAEGKRSGWKQRQLALVPQNLIGKGFGHSCFLIGKTQYEWKAQEDDNLCNGNAAGRKGNRLVSFLESSGAKPPINGTVTGLNAVSSIAAFSRFWKYNEDGTERTPEQRMELITGPMFQNITVWIDEAHHIRGAKDPSDKGLDVVNILGDFVSYAVHHGAPTLHVTLATATPYNSSTILHEDTKKHFKQLRRTFSDYLETANIKQAIVKPVEFSDKAGPVKRFAEEVRKAGPGRFHLAFIPANGQFWRRAKVDTTKLVKAITRELRRQAPWATVLDATTHAGGHTLTKMQGGSASQEDYNVVLACRRGREGLDWSPADFLHVLYLQSQLWEANQVFTRPFSSYKGKRRVDVRYYIASTKDTTERFDTLVLTMRLALEQMDFVNPSPVSMKISDDRRVKLTEAVVDAVGRGESGVESVTAEFGGDADTVKYCRSLFTKLITKNFNHKHAHSDKAYRAAVAEYKRGGHDLFRLGKEFLSGLRSEWDAKYEEYKWVMEHGGFRA
jgi:hypothetical protein